MKIINTIKTVLAAGLITISSAAYAIPTLKFGGEILYTASDFSPDLIRERVSALNPDVRTFALSCKTSAGMEDWIAWLDKELSAFRGQPS